MIPTSEHFDAAEKIEEIGSIREVAAFLAARDAKIIRPLLEIRDKWLPALRRDSMEGDKVLCHVGGIAHLIAVQAPEYQYPPESAT